MGPSMNSGFFLVGDIGFSSLHNERRWLRHLRADVGDPDGHLVLISSPSMELHGL